MLLRVYCKMRNIYFSRQESMKYNEVKHKRVHAWGQAEIVRNCCQNSINCHSVLIGQSDTQKLVILPIEDLHRSSLDNPLAFPKGWIFTMTRKHTNLSYKTQTWLTKKNKKRINWKMDIRQNLCGHGSHILGSGRWFPFNQNYFSWFVSKVKWDNENCFLMFIKTQIKAEEKSYMKNESCSRKLPYPGKWQMILLQPSFFFMICFKSKIGQWKQFMIVLKNPQIKAEEKS